MPWIAATDEPWLSAFMNAQGLGPRMRRAHRDLFEAIMQGSSPLSRTEREAIAVAVSELNGSTY
jgi:alkylhydroperoxidase family enzyme